MSSTARHDAVIAAWLADGPTGLPAADRAAIADAAEQIAQSSGILWRWRALSRHSYRLAAVAVAVATMLLAAAIFGPIGGRPRPTSLVWTLESFREPFPAPLRAEPIFGGPLLQAELTFDPRLPAGRAWTYEDTLGDTTPEAVGYADLASLAWREDCWRGDGFCLWYRPATALTRPFGSPTSEWFVYGVDFDNDGDGRADLRFGVDNQPGDSLRAWSTDLRTGVMTYRTGIWPDHARLWEVELPMADGQGDARGRGYAHLASELITPDGVFYVWTAVIRDGEIAAMDFAPGVGWLDSPSNGEKND